ncbi:hypothetical protein ACHEVJ_17080 [Enterococcus raffinosus]|uniref:hypothetical protein n=1 Tax=Enterococcus raffinosus TaxID=71452 RepID=UPI003757085D
MINEKIQRMLKELQRECEKEGVSALCTLHKEANALQLLVGGLPDVAALLAIQESELDNKFSDKRWYINVSYLTMICYNTPCGSSTKWRMYL